MTALVTLLTVIAMSLLITRVATVALVSTGLSRESARFQARSAFSGSGFTTGESESVVSHPVRRRIIMILMLLGNAGIVTVISTLVLGFVNTQGAVQWLPRIIVLVVGLTSLWFLATSRVVDRVLNRMIEKALKRWTHLDVSDYAGLLHLASDYRVVEMKVEAGDWVASGVLQELRLVDEGILVLGIERPGVTYAGTPRGSATLQAGDTLILYGRAAALQELDSRKAGAEGDAAHRRATIEQGVIGDVEEAEMAGGVEAEAEAGAA